MSHVHRLLTIAETCDRLRISRRTFYDLVGAGELTSVRIGRAHRLTEESVDEFIERHATKASR